MKRSARYWAFSLLPLLCLGAALHAQSAPAVVTLTLHDTIQPISAGYLQRGLAEAERTHAALVLVSLDTPGGLLDSTRTMVTAIERSPVPVAVFVSPTGARAGSAGFFLLQAADIAAMAPGTNAGAAHPILPGRTMDPVLKLKIENDAAAFLRAVVLRRGRNAEAAEDAVRNSKSSSDTEALNLHLIDLIVPDDASLLRAFDGRTIHRFDGRAETLHLANAAVVVLAPSLRERVLTRLTNPDLAVLLLLFGMLLIYAEFNIPGTVIPGAVGALMVLLALFGLNLLPVRHTAVALVLAAAVLLLLELKIPSHGIVASAGVAALVFGLATLVDGPVREMQVHPSIAVAAGVGFGMISFFLASLALRARRNKILLGPQAMLGKLGIARTALNPAGQVEVRGELWQAMLRNDALNVVPGGTVLICEARGLHLLVDPSTELPPTPFPRAAE